MRGKKLRGRRPAKHAAEIEDAATSPLREKLAHGCAIGKDQRREVQVQGRAPTAIRQLVQRAIAGLSSAATGNVVKAMEPIEFPQGDSDSARRRGRTDRS